MSNQQIYDYIERLSNLIRADARRSGAEQNLQPVQLDALHYLAICNRYSDTPMAVTEYLGQTKGTVSQTLKVLETKGLITKQQDLDDKRVTHLCLTPAGKTILSNTIPPEQFEQACNALGKNKQEITDALKRLLQSIQRVNNLKTFGVCSSCRYNQKAGKAYLCGLTEEPLSSSDIRLICREHSNA